MFILVNFPSIPKVLYAQENTFITVLLNEP